MAQSLGFSFVSILALVIEFGLDTLNVIHMLMTTDY